MPLAVGDVVNVSLTGSPTTTEIAGDDPIATSDPGTPFTVSNCAERVVNVAVPGVVPAVTPAYVNTNDSSEPHA